MAYAQNELVTRETLQNAQVRQTDAVLVALSGGADSVALLDAMNALLQKGEISALFAAHVNHGIRGERANADEAFCVSLCKSLGVPLSVFRVDATAFAKERRMTLEEAARTLRYDALREAKAQTGADCILLAHHANDQAETVLMHILRGCGLAGLCGMQARKGDLARPLLGVSRAEIDAYLSQNGLPHCVDESNETNDAFRNRVRHEILPAMQAENPAIVLTLCRMADLVSQDESYLSELATAAQKTVLKGDSLDAAALDALPHPLKARVVHRLLQPNVTETDVQSVLRLCSMRTGARISLSDGRTAWRDSSRVTLGVYPARSAYEVPYSDFGDAVLPCGVVYAQSVKAFLKPHDETEAYLDRDALCGDLMFRTRRDKDRMFPLGASGSRLFSDVLTDKKIPREMRDMPLLCTGNEVLWAVGVSVSERVRVRETTKRILRLTYVGGNRT